MNPQRPIPISITPTNRSLHEEIKFTGSASRTTNEIKPTTITPPATKKPLVVTLHDIQGLPHDEIARILDCNTATVRTRLFYARQQLQGILSDYLK